MITRAPRNRHPGAKPEYHSFVGQDWSELGSEDPLHRTAGKKSSARMVALRERHVMSQPKLANPSVVQLHNLGLCGLGPVFALAVVFGGGAQIFAGFQEMKMGNHFGFCAFTGYGAFWISFALLLLCKRFGVFPVEGNDVGWFLVAYTAFTLILWLASMRVSKGHFTIFSLLLIGFILLDLEHFGFPGLKTVAALELIGCAIAALYGMAHVIFQDLAGRDVLPMGAPLIKA
jgi:hypothetical protein